MGKGHGKAIQKIDTAIYQKLSNLQSNVNENFIC